VFAPPPLAQGERVAIVDGPLSGVQGIFVRGKTSQGCLVVSIDLLGRSVAVEVDSSAVVPVSSRRAA
jgi:transcription termination/antitermination protein NusG